MRGLVLLALGLAGPVLFVVSSLGLAVACCGLLPLGERLMDRCRDATNVARRLAGQWSGVEIPVPYLPVPSAPVPDADGWYRHDNNLYRTPRVPSFMVRVERLARDPATTRDLLWMLLNPLVGGVLAVLAIVGGSRILRLHGRWTRCWLATAAPSASSVWLRERLTALWRVLLLAGLSVVNFLAALVVLVVGVLAHVTGLFYAWPPVVESARALTDHSRRLAGRWAGVPIPDPYLPVPPPPEPTADGFYLVARTLRATPGPAVRFARYRRVVRDRATWRDLGWQLLDPAVTGLLVLPTIASVLLFGWGFWAQLWLWIGGFLLDTSPVWRATDIGPTGFLVATQPWSVLLGLAAGGLALVIGPATVRAHGRWARLLLAPTERALLAREVRRLAETRTEASAEEVAGLRRIERDLHDGAQARLVALGLKLGAVEHLMDQDPERARRLLAESREDSGQTLTELRELVRGIRPPVLAERGLADALRALALDSVVPVEVEVTLDGRCPPAVESAAYFAVSELIANALKHTDARTVHVSLRHAARLLTITVTDDGRGGVDPGQGTGLRGIQRRLGAFDGTFDLSSPPGGPTRVTLEIPCALSSPKTSSCSEMA